MSTLLKQSTAVDIGLGPFVDNSDGFTPSTGLTISQADVRLKKNGGAWAQKNDTNAATHEENGWYEVALNTTDTNTLGILLVAVNESGALPVWREFVVVPANVYDSLVGGSDALQVHTTEIANDLITAAALAADAVTEIQSGLSTLTQANVRSAVGLASANLDTQLDALPTATENADALLKRDWTAVSGEAARSVLNALRFLRNKWSVSGATLTVTTENDVTTAWQATVTTDAAAEPVTGSDPS